LNIDTRKDKSRNRELAYTVCFIPIGKCTPDAVHRFHMRIVPEMGTFGKGCNRPISINLFWTDTMVSVGA